MHLQNLHNQNDSQNVAVLYCQLQFVVMCDGPQCNPSCLICAQLHPWPSAELPLIKSYPSVIDFITIITVEFISACNSILLPFSLLNLSRSQPFPSEQSILLGAKFSRKKIMKKGVSPCMDDENHLQPLQHLFGFDFLYAHLLTNLNASLTPLSFLSKWEAEQEKGWGITFQTIHMMLIFILSLMNFLFF